MPSAASVEPPSSSGPTLDREAAAQRYLEIVDGHNAAVNDFAAARERDAPWQEEQAALRVLFQADEKEGADLAATAWPADVRPLIDQLIQAKLANRQAMSAATRATTREEYLRLLDVAFANDECAEANAVRGALGLEPAGGDCPTG